MLVRRLILVIFVLIVQLSILTGCPVVESSLNENVFNGLTGVWFERFVDGKSFSTEMGFGEAIGSQKIEIRRMSDYALEPVMVSLNIGECMRRKIVKFLLISLSLGVFAGCGSTDGDNKEIKEVNDTDCKSEYPKAQPANRPCCPEWGVDACEPGRVCTTLGERTQPLCYAKESRSTGESCTVDALCKSGACAEGSCKLGPRNRETEDKEPVNVDLALPEGKEYILDLSGLRTATFSGNGAGLNRLSPDTASFDLSSVTPNNENLTLKMTLGLLEGATGNFLTQSETTAILGSGQYVPGTAIRVTVNKYSSDIFRAEFAGTFDETSEGEPVSEPLRVEGKVEFEI